MLSAAPTKPLRAEADRLAFAGNAETERGNLDRADEIYARAGFARKLAWERGEYDEN